MRAIISRIEFYPIGKNGKAKSGQLVKEIYFKLLLPYHGKIIQHKNIWIYGGKCIMAESQNIEWKEW